MLMISRKPGERILITLDPATDSALTARDLFARGAIEIIIAETGPVSARLAIEAPRSLLISRFAKEK